MNPSKFIVSSLLCQKQTTSRWRTPKLNAERKINRKKSAPNKNTLTCTCITKELYASLNLKLTDGSPKQSNSIPHHAHSCLSLARWMDTNLLRLKTRNNQSKGVKTRKTRNNQSKGVKTRKPQLSSFGSFTSRTTNHAT